MTVVKVKGKKNTFKDVNVRRERVHSALLWLIQGNYSHYREVAIDFDALSSLPENDVPFDNSTVEADTDVLSDELANIDRGPASSENEEDIVYSELTEMSSFLPLGPQQEQEVQAIKSQLSGDKPLNWPSHEEPPLNEYTTPFLATMAFPTLFPEGNSDPTDPSVVRNVSLYDGIKYLPKFAENIDNKWIYRFANHPRFSYWTFDMLQRKRTLQESGIFLKQNPGEAHLTIDELKEMAANNN